MASSHLKEVLPRNPGRNPANNEAVCKQVSVLRMSAQGKTEDKQSRMLISQDIFLLIRYVKTNMIYTGSTARKCD